MDKPVTNPLVQVNKVNSLIYNDRKEWNEDLLDECFNPNVKHQIMQLRLPVTGEDVFRWTLTKNGCAAKN
ncbi:hypothetical protein BVC80_505g11 [Macleaya cordata]|uniref:Uncharacterized protein n=1 Tax=Macleaya cordata TaxID=56857 RepID=A0A200PTG5_MACCD|nr:hypothetical protein BVC80_505g11 [Macleaya cordata]